MSHLRMLVPALVGHLVAEVECLWRLEGGVLEPIPSGLETHAAG